MKFDEMIEKSVMLMNYVPLCISLFWCLHVFERKLTVESRSSNCIVEGIS